PTRLAESSTSIPPPEPRSSTVSPGFNWARAVGLPQPREACSASAGSSATWSRSYRFDVIGSARHEGPQQPDAQSAPSPFVTWIAARAYFSFTASLMSIDPTLPDLLINASGF